jgi:hypothetical protein
MPKLIKQIHDLIGLAIDKGYTQYISDSQIDDAIDQGQMVLFRELVKEFPRNKRVRNDLLPFEVRASVTLSSKVGSIPSDFEHEVEAWYTTTAATPVEYPIQFVESGFYRKRLRDVVDPPTTANIFASIYNDTTRKVEISSNITPITLVYLKRPPKPEYVTTGPSNGQYIYDDTTSTDVSWAASMHDILVEKTLGILGLNMRDQQVQRAGQDAQPKQATL